MKQFTAEAVGTFALVFAGTGAIVIDSVSDGAVTHVGVALSFGLIVMAMVYTLGDVSGAHINPAVTVGFWLAGRFERRLVLPYVTAQCTGALCASGLLRLMFPDAQTLGATLPAGSVTQSFLLEIALTALLMFVILCVTTGSESKSQMAGVVIGAVVALEALFAGPISGASMNPARSLGPAVVSGEVGTLWIYLTAPVIGAIVGIGGCRCVQPRGCCAGMDCAT